MDTDLVQQAITHFNLDPSRVERVEDSYSSVVRILTLAAGERVVLKIPYVRRKLFRELSALQHLQGDLPVPKVLDYWVPGDDGPGALLLSLLPGRVITGPVSVRLAAELGSLLARLHAHRLDRYGDSFVPGGDTSTDWWGILRRTFETWKPLCAGVMPQDLFRQTLDRYEMLYASLPEPSGPCWVHCDYRPGNVLVDGQNITGLIDFESARGGSPGLDFVKMQNEVWNVTPGTGDAFHRGYRSLRPLPELERTLPFYTLHFAFGGVAWCVRRSGVDDPFFHENMSQIERCLLDA